MAKNGKKAAPVEIVKLDVLREWHRQEELKVIRAALESEGWFLKEAAKKLGIASSSLQYIVDHDPELLRDAEKERKARVVRAAEERVAAARRELDVRKGAA